MKEENYLEGIYGCLKGSRRKWRRCPWKAQAPQLETGPVPRKDCGTENPSGTPAIRGGEKRLGNSSGT